MANLRVIYEPTGPAKEYADLALNLYNGCVHGCVYCYNNGRFSKSGDFFKGPKPRMGLSGKIAADARALIEQYGDAVPEVLISFVGDAYQPAENTLGISRLAIQCLIKANIPFTILTKSGLVKRDRDILGPYRDKFRLGMTILTADQSLASQWEPYAPLIAERIETLKIFKALGVKTWVSLEPVMQAAAAVDLIEKIHELVDFWQVGKLNHMAPPQPVDWRQARQDIQAALERKNSTYKFKSSFG